MTSSKILNPYMSQLLCSRQHKYSSVLKHENNYQIPVTLEMNEIDSDLFSKVNCGYIQSRACAC